MHSSSSYVCMCMWMWRGHYTLSCHRVQCQLNTNRSSHTCMHKRPAGTLNRTHIHKFTKAIARTNTCCFGCKVVWVNDTFIHLCAFWILVNLCLFSCLFLCSYVECFYARYAELTVTHTQKKKTNKFRLIFIGKATDFQHSFEIHFSFVYNGS